MPSNQMEPLLLLILVPINAHKLYCVHFRINGCTRIMLLHLIVFRGILKFFQLSHWGISFWLNVVSSSISNGQGMIEGTKEAFVNGFFRMLFLKIHPHDRISFFFLPSSSQSYYTHVFWFLSVHYVMHFVGQTSPQQRFNQVIKSI